MTRTMLASIGWTVPLLSLAVTQPAAAQFLFGRNAVQIAAGLDHTCVINGCGTVQCWGRNDFGQATPPPVAFDEITAGLWHTCGIRADNGQVQCWGRAGLLLQAPATQYDRIEAGDLHTCGLRSDGGLECWGYNWNGSVYGAPGPRPGSTTTDISAGTHLTCATYDSHPAVTCVGGGPLGQPLAFQTPQLRTGYGYPDQITSGLDFSCIILGGYLQCFGEDNQGQVSGLGVDPRFPSTAVGVPVGQSFGFGNVDYLAVSAGIDHACAIEGSSASAGGPLRCWGRGHNGPSKTALPSGSYVQVASGRNHMCAIDTQGAVRCASWAPATSYYETTAIPAIGCQIKLREPPRLPPYPLVKIGG